jgi:hypothetical protein
MRWHRGLAMRPSPIADDKEGGPRRLKRQAACIPSSLGDLGQNPHRSTDWRSMRITVGRRKGCFGVRSSCARVGESRPKSPSVAMPISDLSMPSRSMV